MFCAKAKTRQLLCECSGALRPPTSQVCRAGGIEPCESVCQRHFDKIRREDDKTCSCPSSWGHSRRLHAHPVPTKYYQILDQVGRSSASSYKPGTRCCNKCRNEAPKRFKNWPQLEEEITKVCFIIKYPILITLYFRKLEAGENKILNFHVYCFFVSCHNFELLQFCILLIAPLKCENYFKLVT